MDLHNQMQLTVVGSVAAGLCTLAAIVLPGDDLGWPRLIIGFAAFIAVSIGGAWIITRHLNKEN